MLWEHVGDLAGLWRRGSTSSNWGSEGTYNILEDTVYGVGVVADKSVGDSDDAVTLAGRNSDRHCKKG